MEETDWSLLRMKSTSECRNIRTLETQNTHQVLKFSAKHYGNPQGKTQGASPTHLNQETKTHKNLVTEPDRKTPKPHPAKSLRYPRANSMR